MSGLALLAAALAASGQLMPPSPGGTFTPPSPGGHLTPPPSTRLPEGTARWRMELAGEPVGLVELTIACAGPACDAAWSSRQRLPAEGGGGERVRRTAVTVDRAGRAAGPARIADGGRSREVALPAGAVPAMLVELLLARAPGACLDAADEATGRPLRACARTGPPGSPVRLDVGGLEERVRPGAGPFPAEVEVPAQRVRFVLDPAAAVPAGPPRLYGVAVEGPADPRDAARFCGAPVDAGVAAEAALGLPAPAAPGPTCREQSAAWAEQARRAGLEARIAVGVAHDGAAFVWHAWAEARAAGRWIPVDPAFRQAPARGPRFTLATFAPGDEAARRAAGQRVLECWGRARVEGVGR